MRSPRKTAGQSPARLDPGVAGKGGDFQDKEAKAKAEAEKIAAREKAVAKQNREDAAKTSSFSFYSMSKAYSKTMKKRPKATASMQAVATVFRTDILPPLIGPRSAYDSSITP